MHFYILFTGKQFCGYKLRDESDRNGDLENEPSRLNPLRVTRVPFTGEGKSLRSSNEGESCLSEHQAPSGARTQNPSDLQSGPHQLSCLMPMQCSLSALYFYSSFKQHFIPSETEGGGGDKVPR